jgi:hypothetical protein
LPAVPVASAVAAGSIVFIQPMPMLTQNGVPPGNPQPGTPGGGASPTSNTPTAIQALALVPLGTVPVAIFPPYATPRTRPAVSVIFSEDPSILAMNRALMRFKRSSDGSLFPRSYRRSYRRPSFISAFLRRSGLQSG